ncbi:cytochrome P450 714C2-like [Eucalyptus grandis]|uniref:cytochrome P450 714C2-like n=1 Tax=Eucalyptus grandis TaxID=71139 RepID=UPI0008A0D4DC|nr:cytochrome P450 714C2-like [Eucalyptus grandis]
MPGSNYDQGQEIFSKLRALQEAISKIAFTSAVPGFGYLPTKTNREVGKLERGSVLDPEGSRGTKGSNLGEGPALNDTRRHRKCPCVGKRRCSGPFHHGQLQEHLGRVQRQPPFAAAWTLILLASNPGWQAKVCQEVVQALHGGQLPMLT